MTNMWLLGMSKNYESRRYSQAKLNLRVTAVYIPIALAFLTDPIRHPQALTRHLLVLREGNPSMEVHLAIHSAH